MNVEELTYLGAHFAGGAMGFYQGLSQTGLGAGIGGLVVGLVVGWALCFFPFLTARTLEDRAKARWAEVLWRLGFAAPLLAPLVMFFLW